MAQKSTTISDNAAKMTQEIEAWLPVATSTDHDHRAMTSTLA
jgi:hypothetical protein